MSIWLVRGAVKTPPLVPAFKGLMNRALMNRGRLRWRPYAILLEAEKDSRVPRIEFLMTLHLRRAFIAIQIVLAVGVLAALTLLDIRVSFVLPVAILAGFIGVAWRDQIDYSPVWLLDLGVCLLLVSSLVSQPAALYLTTARIQTGICAVACSLYFAVRNLRQSRTLLLVLAAGVVMCYGSRGVIEFLRSYRTWSSLGFTQLADFRAFVALTPFGTPSGVANATYLSFFPLCALAFVSLRSSIPRLRFILMLPITLCGVCVLLSFSRGLYISAALGVMVALYYLPRRYTYYAALCAIVFCSVLYLAHSAIGDAILNTASLHQTTSRRLSAVSRWSFLRSGISLITKSPIVGVGPGNFALGLSAYAPRTTQGLVSQPFNAFVSITVEQGLLGATALSVIYIGAFILLWHFPISADRNRCAILRGGYVALVVYSLCQAYLLADRASTGSTFLFLGLMPLEYGYATAKGWSAI
jgi:hypothetical protein